MRFKSPEDGGATSVPVTVVTGLIPSYQAGTQNMDKAPVISVRATAGSFHRVGGECTIHVFILTWDDDQSRDGYLDVLDIITAIYSGLYEEGALANAFLLLDQPVKWSMIEDISLDTFGYYVGGMQIEFGIMTPGINPNYGGGGWVEGDLQYSGVGGESAEVSETPTNNFSPDNPYAPA
jgi:hypothetical protein